MSTTLTPLEQMSRLTAPELVDRFHAGVKATVFSQLAQVLAVSAESLAPTLGLSARTIRNRKVLNADETELTYRTYRVFVRTREVLGGDEAARQWLVTPQRALGDRTPLSLLQRDVGAQEVLNLLGAIEDGGYL
jgi:putative toxin-antitoxin system antitoxin component (TIGR02293 family)